MHDLLLEGGVSVDQESVNEQEGFDGDDPIASLVEPLGNGDERSVDVASGKRRQCQDFSDVFFIGGDLFVAGGFDD